MVYSFESARRGVWTEFYTRQANTLMRNRMPPLLLRTMYMHYSRFARRDIVYTVPVEGDLYVGQCVGRFGLTHQVPLLGILSRATSARNNEGVYSGRGGASCFGLGLQPLRSALGEG